MKKIKSIISIFLLSFILLSMTGCVTYGNKGIDDLTDEEISEAVSNLAEAKDELEDELADSPKIREFTTGILDMVQNAFEDE